MASQVVPALERGSLRLDDRVVAKIAAQAAHEALRGDPEQRAAARAPHAAVSVRRLPGLDNRGGRAHARVAVELGYPCDIGTLCGAVRDRVAARLGELAGMTRCEVVVDVQRLHSVHLADEDAERVR